MWQFISRFILRNRAFLLISIAIFTAFMGYKASFLTMKYEYAQMLPDTDSAVINLNKFKQYFGEDGSLMVVGIEDPNFFELEKFNAWGELARNINTLEGIEGVVTVNNIVELKRNGTKKKFDTAPVFPDVIENQEQLDSLKLKFESLRFYEGVVYNPETHVYLMGITMNKAILNSKARFGLVDSMFQHIETYNETQNVQLRYSGLPYTRTRIAEMVRAEIGLFILMAALVTAFILYLFFRSFKVVIISMTVVGIGVVWAMGTVVLLGYQMSILTSMIPPLIIVIGIPNCVFLLNKFHTEFQNHKNKIKALQRIIQKIGNATFLTNLTTASGFGTFVITGNPFLIEFGIVTFLNIMGVFLISLILIPVIFSFLDDPKERHTKHLQNKAITKIVELLVVVTQKYRTVTYVLILTMIIAGGFGMLRIKSTGYIVDDIPHNDPVYVDLKFFEEHINGVMPVEIVVDTKKPKGVLKYSLIKRLNKLQKRLERYPELSPSTSIANGLKFARQAYFNGGEHHYKLPSSQETQFIMAYLANNKSEAGIMDAFVDSTGQITRISLRVEDVGTQRMQALQDSIVADVHEVFSSDKYNVTVTGSSFVFTKGTTYLINNLFTSLGLAIIIIGMFMAWMFRSARMVVISILPNLLPLMFTAALMGYLSIPIKPSTVLVFSIAFGISVDNAIHFLAKYRQELQASNWNIKVSVINALRETGVSIMYTAIILFFGFGIFIVSDFGGTKSLGSLVSITLLVAMLANLVLLPSLLLTLEKYITTKAFNTPRYARKQSRRNE